jgi:hypothetical protein
LCGVTHIPAFYSFYSSLLSVERHSPWWKILLFFKGTDGCTIIPRHAVASYLMGMSNFLFGKFQKRHLRYICHLRKRRNFVITFFTYMNTETNIYFYHNTTFCSLITRQSMATSKLFCTFVHFIICKLIHIYYKHENK